MNQFLRKLDELKDAHVRARETGGKLVDASSFGILRDPEAPPWLVRQPSLEEWEADTLHYTAWQNLTNPIFMEPIIRGVNPHDPKSRPLVEYEFARAGVSHDFIKYSRDLDLQQAKETTKETQNHEPRTEAKDAIQASPADQVRSKSISR